VYILFILIILFYIRFYSVIMYIVVDYREKELIKLLKAFGQEYKWWRNETDEKTDKKTDTNTDTNTDKKGNNEHKIKMYVENLPLGDVIIYDGFKSHQETGTESQSETQLGTQLHQRTEEEELLIIERKSLPDLAASIRDGRYNEQSLRLEHTSIHNHNIIYLIEGKMEFYRPNFTKIDSKTLYSSMFSMMYYKGFSVFRTQTLVETCNVILYFLDKLYREKIGKFKVPYYENKRKSVSIDEGYEIDEIQTGTQLSIQSETQMSTQSERKCDKESETNSKQKVVLKKEFLQNTQHNLNTISEIKNNKELHFSEQTDYSQVIKKVKKSNITQDNIGEIMLSQIPGISTTLSKAILSYFGSLCSLLDSLREDERCLDNVSYMTNKSQVRKLSEKCKQSLKTYLLK
jgi:ERCC4-type nuclease